MKKYLFLKSVQLKNGVFENVFFLEHKQLNTIFPVLMKIFEIFNFRHLDFLN